MVDIKFSAEPISDSDLVTIFLSEDLKLSPESARVDHAIGGLISKVLENKDIFDGKFAKTKILSGLVRNNLQHVLLIGTGEASKLSESQLEELGIYAQKAANSLRLKSLSIIVDSPLGGKSINEVGALIASGLYLSSYRFDKYQTKLKDSDKPSLGDVTIKIADVKSAEEAYKKLKAIADGVFLARDVVTEPPNKLFPESYAQRIKQELELVGVEVEVLGEKEMTSLGMGALLGVGQGSIRESKLVVMKYYGASDKKEQPLAFVGKGVTFDTGGISLKPAGGMEDMKYDMGGSAAVVGLMKAVAGRKAKANIIGVVGLVENMPDGNAQRPSDVVTSMSGQTIEVLNTDAEGRLVLADALWYTQKEFKPKFMVNLATLTGAIVIALGELYAGIFSNNDELAKNITESGNKTDEIVWRFPLHSEYEKMMKSDIADIANIATNGKGAGSITAAQFLQKFVGDVPWCHIDIAGVAWTKKDKKIAPKGATGFGVRLLNKLIENYYEAK